MNKNKAINFYFIYFASLLLFFMLIFVVWAHMTRTNRIILFLWIVFFIALAVQTVRTVKAREAETGDIKKSNAELDKLYQMNLQMAIENNLENQTLCMKMNNILQAIEMFNEVNNSGQISKILAEASATIPFDYQINPEKNSLARLINLYKSVARQGNINFIYNIQVELHELDAAYPDIETILDILLQNAFEAAREAASTPQVDLTLSANRDFYELTLSNNGKLIEKEGLDRLFEIDYSTKAPYRGVGLFKVKNFADSYQGSIKITNDDLVKKVYVFLILPKHS